MLKYEVRNRKKGVTMNKTVGNRIKKLRSKKK